MKLFVAPKAAFEVAENITGRFFMGVENGEIEFILDAEGYNMVDSELYAKFCYHYRQKGGKPQDILDVPIED